MTVDNHGLVSIVIPAFNASTTITETLRSIDHQTYPNIEILVVDDGSTDGTPGLVSAYPSTHHLELICQRNGGAPRARNTGLHAARGQYIAFLDADDTWEPSKLQSHVDALSRNASAVAAFSFVRQIDEHGNELGRQRAHCYSGHVGRDLYRTNFLRCGSNLVATREAVLQAGGWDPGLPAAQDLDFSIRLSILGEFELVPDHLVGYRRTAGSISSSADRLIDGTTVVLHRHAEQLGVSRRMFRRCVAGAWAYSAYITMQNRTPGWRAESARRSFRALRWSLAVVSSTTWILAAAALISPRLIGARGHARRSQGAGTL